MFVYLFLTGFVYFSVNNSAKTEVHPFEDKVDSVIELTIISNGDGFFVAPVGSGPVLTAKTFVSSEDDEVFEGDVDVSFKTKDSSNAYLSDKQPPQDVGFMGEKTLEIDFEVNLYELTPLNKDLILSFLEFMKNEGFYEFSITGYASLDGLVLFNRELAEKRAQSVKDLVDEQDMGITVEINEHAEDSASFFKSRSVVIKALPKK